MAFLEVDHVEGVGLEGGHLSEVEVGHPNLVVEQDLDPAFLVPLVVGVVPLGDLGSDPSSQEDLEALEMVALQAAWHHH